MPFLQGLDFLSFASSACYNYNIQPDNERPNRGRLFFLSQIMSVQTEAGYSFFPRLCLDGKKKTKNNKNKKKKKKKKKTNNNNNQQKEQGQKENTQNENTIVWRQR